MCGNILHIWELSYIVPIPSPSSTFLFHYCSTFKNPTFSFWLHSLYSLLPPLLAHLTTLRNSMFTLAFNEHVPFQVFLTSYSSLRALFTSFQNTFIHLKMPDSIQPPRFATRGIRGDLLISGSSPSTRGDFGAVSLRRIRFSEVSVVCLNWNGNRTRNHGYKLVPPRFTAVLYRDLPTVRVTYGIPRPRLSWMRPQSMRSNMGRTRSFLVSFC